MPESLISVIIPLYNKAECIGRALDSVLTQHFDRFEILVIDDGSTDNGCRVVEQYNDPRIQLFRQENAGPGYARNTGLRKSRGKYVVFLDADDEFMPDFLEVSLKHIESNPECSLSVVDHFSTAEKIPWLTLTPELTFAQGPWRLPNDTPAKLAKTTVDFFQSGAVLCLRKIVMKYGGFYENNCTYGEDNYIWLQVILNHWVYIDRTPLIWHHTEDSELGDKRVGGYPPWPKLTDPQPIRKNCPDEYRDFLEQALVYYAILACKRCLQSGDLNSVKWLMNEYSGMSAWKEEYREIKCSKKRMSFKKWAKRLNILNFKRLLGA